MRLIYLGLLGISKCHNSLICKQLKRILSDLLSIRDRLSAARNFYRCLGTDTNSYFDLELKKFVLIAKRVKTF